MQTEICFSGTDPALLEQLRRILDAPRRAGVSERTIRTTLEEALRLSRVREGRARLKARES